MIETPPRSPTRAAPGRRPSLVQRIASSGLVRRASERPADLVTVVLFGAGFAYLLWAHRAMYEAFILPPGSDNANSLFMWSGAPASHLEAEHPLAHGFYRALSRPGAFLFVLPLTTLYACAWRRVYNATGRFWTRLLASVAFVEGALLVVDLLFSTTLAFHHTGWGKACNWQPWTALVGLNMYGLPCALLPLLADTVANWIAGRNRTHIGRAAI
ncbi:MAG: hypothetical protein HY303_09425 [Candidatus Wallbacteria bacterium]|nr:hypothetical protein [Candidatus Wallbacteria bacterium]